MFINSNLTGFYYDKVMVELNEKQQAILDSYDVALEEGERIIPLAVESFARVIASFDAANMRAYENHYARSEGFKSYVNLATADDLQGLADYLQGNDKYEGLLGFINERMESAAAQEQYVDIEAKIISGNLEYASIFVDNNHLREHALERMSILIAEENGEDRLDPKTQADEIIAAANKILGNEVVQIAQLEGQRIDGVDGPSQTPNASDQANSLNR